MAEPLDDRPTADDPPTVDDQGSGDAGHGHVDGAGPATAGIWPSSDDERARALRRTIGRKAIRRARARRRRDESVWAWMGTFGLVGWTVVVPTLLGLAIGVYIDNRVDGPVSFAITLLVTGAAAGSAMAWYWVREESGGGDDR